MIKKVKIKIGRRTTRAELAALVTRALENVGDHPMLVGGGVVDIYTDGRYKSDDLDIITYRSVEQLQSVMKELGFVKKGMHWQHPDTELMVQFLPSPAMVGNKYVRTPHRIETRAGDFPLYSPLDSACDRLAWFLEGDQKGMRQCIDIVVKQNVSLDDIEAWLVGENWTVQQKTRAMAKLREHVAQRLARRR